MFEFNKTEIPSMHLNKVWVDYVSLYKNKENPVLLSKTERFRQNTSGLRYGDREFVEKRVERLSTSAGINQGVYNYETIHLKLMEKIDSVSDYDINRNDNMRRAFFHSVFRFVEKEIKTETYKSNKKNPVEEYIDENDRDSKDEGNKKMTTAGKMYQSGMMEDTYYEIDYDVERAKQDIIESLEVMHSYNESLFVTTKEKKKLNCIKILLNEEAYARMTEESQRVNELRDLFQNSGQINRMTSSTRSTGSLGLGKKSYFATILKLILHEEAIGERVLLKTFAKFSKAVDYLKLDLIWLEDDLIVKPEYIQKLKSAIYDDSSVFISFEEVDVLDSTINLHDHKVNELRNSLLKEKELPNKYIPRIIAGKNLERIKSLKASELRKISTIAKQMYDGFVENNRNNRFISASEGQKRDSEMLEFTREYQQRVHLVETQYLTQGYTVVNPNDENKHYPGVFSKMSLDAIKLSFQRYSDKVLETNFEYYYSWTVNAPSKYPSKYKFEDKEYPVKADAHGFLYFDYTDGRNITYKRYLYETFEVFKQATESGNIDNKMDKWLINNNGFYVNKFVDGLVRKGKETIPLLFGKLDEGDALMMKDFNKRDIPIFFN